MPRKNKPRGDASPEHVAATTETMVKVARLRAGGASYREIGRRLEIDHTWAWELCQRALREATYEAAAEMRALVGMRLDQLLLTYTPRALNGDAKAAELVRRVIADQRTLFGLDAPTRVDVADVTDDVRALAVELGVALPDLPGE